ncbi:MAG: hypothetical protein H0T50_10540 [Gemmatimonadales bacterium]|nr:hypothetical protein [Gemmatimonadales bacterium]
MTLTPRELRFGWAALAVATAAALLFDGAGWRLWALWLALVAAGAMVLAPSAGADRAAAVGAEVSGTPAGRLSLIGLAALLALGAVLFSVSAALFFATLLGAVCLLLSTWSRRGARGVLVQTATVGGACLLALGPVELLLHIPFVARDFGLPSETARQEARYDRLWTHNVFRFRSPHESVARRPGTRRIIALGDSFTWGLYIADSDSTWPAVLERRLTAATPDAPTEVINMGQRGWTTANEAELLRRVGWQFAPDLVVVQYFMNDAYPSAPDFKFDQPERTYLLPEAFWKGYVRSSSVAALVSLAINGIRYGLLKPNAEGGSLYEPGSPGYLQFKAALHEIGDSARVRGTPVLFVLFPSLVPGKWTPETYPLRALYRQVAADAKAAGLEPLDLTAAFAAEGGDWIRWWAVPYDSHPSAAAHAVVARALHTHLASPHVPRSNGAAGPAPASARRSP